MSEREAKRLGRRPMEVGAGGGDLEKPLSLALAVGSGGQWPGEENGRPKFQGREWGAMPPRTTGDGCLSQVS